MGELVRTFRWQDTSLGPISSWPQSLRTAVQIILHSRYAMFIWWGGELLNLYNDPYRAFLGVKHPAALGRSAREVWSEIWDQIGPRTEAVLLRGESTFDKALPLMMARHGYIEETYFTFSYSPLPADDGRIGGIFCAVTEETDAVIGERRLTLLREVTAAMADARTPVEGCDAAARRLEGARRDLPFSLLYVLEADGKTLTLAGQAGIAAGHPAAAPSMSLSDAGAAWPFRRVLETGEPVLVENLAERFADLPQGEWNEPPQTAVLLPLAQQGQKRPAGVLIAGLNPHRRFDEQFRGFVTVLSTQIGGALANANAYAAACRRADHQEMLLTDMTEHQESQSRLAAIVDSADDAIISKGLDSVIRTWNQGATRMFGYTEEEAVGRSILMLIPEELRYEEDEILAKLRAGERIDHYETTRMKKNGEKIAVSITISPIRDQAGRVTGASKIARDISDRRRMERLLMQSEKLSATGRMAATIAHEINNPLESLMNLVFLARVSCDPESPAHRYLLTAEEELERVSHLARQTLGYYRDTSAPTEVTLRELLGNVLSVYNSRLMANGIAVDARYDDLEKIVASKGEMLQVFSNIVANAIDAMSGGGTLTISTRRFAPTGESGIEVMISDTGTGIRPESLPRIFEPFFTTKGELGTGIGLWVARQLVESRGGRISVTSSVEPKRSGTAFTVSIPFAMPEAA